MSEDLTDVTPTFEMVLSMVTVLEVAEMFGVEPDRNGKITSPYNPDEQHASCHLYEDHFYDFSTGRGGNQVDLVLAFMPHLSVGQALWKLWNKSLRAGREPGDVERQVRSVVVPDFTEDLRVADEVGWSPAHERAMPRGVNMERLRINDYVLPGDGCILIPHYGLSKSTCHGVKVRWFDGRKTAWAGSVFTHALYPGRLRSLGETTIAWLVEGESDSWALVDALSKLGRYEDVYALPSGAGAWKDHWVDTLKPYKTVAIVLDNDQAGTAARNKIFKKLDTVERLGRGGNVKNVYVPSLWNDIRVAVIAGWTPPAILRSVA